jgi:hypothetical protein
MGNINPTVYTNGFFGSFLKSPTQMGSFSVDNSVRNISRLGTFNVRKVTGGLCHLYTNVRESDGLC